MSGVTNCIRCGRSIDVDPALSVDLFEGMHWLCFHFEFEHDADPDVACNDIAGCPWWTISYLKDKLRELGVDPEAVIGEAISRKVRDGSTPSG